MIGWAGSWDWMPWWKGHGPSEKEGWSGFFGLPREVRTAENGALRFLPVEEVKLLRSKELLDRTEAVTEAGEPLKLPEADIYELNLTVDRERTTAASCILKLRGGNGRHTGLILDLKNMELKVDRNCSDGESCGVSRSVIYPENPKTLDIRVFMDRCSVEVFANGGKNVHTCRIYPAESQRENCLESVGGRLVVTGLQMWALAGTQK